MNQRQTVGEERFRHAAQGIILDQIELDALKRAGATGEGVRLHSKPLEDGNKQLCQRAILLRGITPPAGITHNTCARQAAISQKFHILKVAAVIESKVSPSGRDNRIVPGKMETA